MPKLKPGDMLKITWWDIVSDAIGDMKDAEPALCVTLGHFWKYKGRGPSRSLVVGLTLFPKEDDSEPRGWDVYPVGCIEKIEVLNVREADRMVVYQKKHKV
jgi:hypothetical protein